MLGPAASFFFSPGRGLRADLAAAEPAAGRQTRVEASWHALVKRTSLIIAGMGSRTRLSKIQTKVAMIKGGVLFRTAWATGDVFVDTGCRALCCLAGDSEALPFCTDDDIVMGSTRGIVAG